MNGVRSGCRRSSSAIELRRSGASAIALPKPRTQVPHDVMVWFVAGGQEQRAIIGVFFCFNLLEAGIESGSDGIVVVHHRGDDGLHLIEAVEGRLILAPDSIDPAAGREQIRRHDDAGEISVKLHGRHDAFGRCRRRQKAQPCRKRISDHAASLRGPLAGFHSKAPVDQACGCRDH
jgi:hypothetical protein